MTVVDPLSSSSGGGAATAMPGPPLGGGGGPGPVGVGPHGMANVGPAAAAYNGRGGGVNGNPPMVLQAQEEILTSLRFIKDIRRLETYQRDFFLKVKESLTNVQLLLDHQLMDMAWSDKLIDCEESLLKASCHLSSSSPAQIGELYALMINDREKLNHRFQELSIKSSLSEFVVNSRALLDVETVHVATESILRNEKPPSPKPDKSIPVDHTFFLANFCTTSIASTMVSSFMPKRDSITSSNSGSLMSGIGAGYQQRNSSGSAGPSSAYDMHSKKAVAAAAAAAAAAASAANYYGSDSTSVLLNNGGGGGGNNSLYNGAEFMALAAAAQQHSSKGDLVGKVGLTGSVQSAAPVNDSGGELVAAISQITRSPSNATSSETAAVAAAGATGGQVTSGSPGKVGGRKANDPWGQEDSNKAPPGFIGHNGFNGSSIAIVDPASNAMVDLQDASTESVTSEKEAGTIIDFDSSKPLSFARIASLNLEKQAIGQRNAAAAVAVAGSNSQQLMTDHLQQSLTPLSKPVIHATSASPQTIASTLLQNAAAAAAALPPPASAHMQQHPHQQQQAAVQVAAAMAANFLNTNNSNATLPLIQLPPTNNPRYFFDLAMEGKRLGRVIIEVQPTMAPKMSQNFGHLVTGEKGFGYKGCQFFQAWKNESVICGDWEHNSGRGGRAALEGGPLFTPDETRLPCIRGAVGMRRMSKKHSSLNQVASQFRIILANMNTQFTGIFGHVVCGIEALDKVANIGGEGGRPEKVAVVANCGIFKA